MNAKRDQNFTPVWLAYNETTGLTEPIRVDPVLKAVLVYAVGNDGSVFSTINNAKIDGNYVKTKLGYNSTTRNTEAIRCNSSGSLIITLAV